MTAEEMKKEVRNYCLNLILNSSVEDWDNGSLIKNNIVIYKRSYSSSSAFSVGIYLDNTCKEKDCEIEFGKFVGWFQTSETRKERKAIKKKFNEIDEYLRNKKEYEDALATYNLLPITEIRRKKLENLSENEDTETNGK